MTHHTLASSDDVNARIDELAAQITNDFGDERPVFVALLRGAAPFASKLMFAIQRHAPEFHPELDYMMVSTYGEGQKAGAPHIVTDLAPETDVADRTVVIVDDVLDKGITAQFVTEHMKSRGAHDVKLAVLAEKRADKVYGITADYCGFMLDDVWLVGMGMDNASAGKEFDRWNSAIEVVDPS